MFGVGGRGAGDCYIPRATACCFELQKILISRTLSYLNLPKQQQEQTEIGTLHRNMVAITHYLQ